MDPKTKYVLIATVIVAAIIIMVVLSRRFLGRDDAEGYRVASPATPLVESAMGKVVDDLTLICAYGKAYMDARGSTWTPEAVDGTAAAVASITKVLENSGSKIKRTPPSWDNYAQIYRALGGSDRPMLQSAQQFIDAGRAIQQRIAENPGDPDTNYYTVAGDALIKLGRQIRSLIVSTHNLGVSLDLE